MFPISSELSGTANFERLHQVYLDLSRHLFFLNMAQLVVFAGFSRDILTMWMGHDFADKSYVILFMVSIGFFFDTLTNLPSQVCDGMGFPKVTSIFALLRGLTGIGLTVVGGHLRGVEGVAAGYMASCVIVAFAFNIYVHGRIIKVPYLKVVRVCGENFVVGVAMLAALWLGSRQSPADAHSIIVVLAKAAIVGAALCAFGYTRVLDRDERSRVHQKGRRLIRQAVQAVK
jgi:O-antigen/teichoic acid export membrane protein